MKKAETAAKTATKTTTKVTPKAPAPRGRKKTHKKPVMTKEAKEAEKVVTTMYGALTAPDAPKATARGYVMGASLVLKMLIDQAVQQGEDRDELRRQAMSYLYIM